MQQLPAPQFPEVVSSSLRATFNSCHRKSYYETIVGIRPSGKNIHFVFGGAYAHALEYFRRTYYKTNDFDLAVASGLEALILSYGRFEPHDSATKTFDRCVGAYIEYLYRFNPKEDHLQTSVGPTGDPRVEFSFAYAVDEVRHPVTGNPLIFSGRFDQLVDYNGALFVFDDKTTGQLGASWSAQWDLRSQFTGYCFGARQADLPVVGAVIRGMGVYKTKYDVVDAITYRPQWMVDRWHRRLVWDLKRMVACWESDYWPHTGEESGACSAYGGCPYSNLCLAADERSYLSAFEQSRYMPLAAEGERDRNLPVRFMADTPRQSSSSDAGQ